MSDEPQQIIEDRALAARVAAGDRQAFDAFFREYFPRLFRFTLLRVNNDMDLAEELVQKTMCVVVRKMATYRGEAQLFSWLCQICRNEMKALFKKRRIEFGERLPIEDHPDVQAALESLFSDDGRPETAQRRDEIARFVQTTLAYLPTRYAIALEMKYVQGRSVAEIGTALGIGDKAAESLLSRARKAFKEGFRSLWDLDPAYLMD